MADTSPHLTNAHDFVTKWQPRLQEITDPVVRELIVDLVNVVWQIEAEAIDAYSAALNADAQAQRARSRATWGLLGGW